MKLMAMNDMNGRESCKDFEKHLGLSLDGSPLPGGHGEKGTAMRFLAWA